MIAVTIETMPFRDCIASIKPLSTLKKVPLKMYQLSDVEVLMHGTWHAIELSSTITSLNMFICVQQSSLMRPDPFKHSSVFCKGFFFLLFLFSPPHERRKQKRDGTPGRRWNPFFWITSVSSSVWGFGSGRRITSRLPGSGAKNRGGAHKGEPQCWEARDRGWNLG